MTSRLQDVLALMQPLILERVPETTFEVLTQLAQHANNAAPRVAFVRTRDRVTPADKSARPRRLALIRSTVAAFVWGVDDEQTEELEHAIVFALHHTAPTSLRAITGEWEAPEVANFGQAVTLFFEVDIPVEDRAVDVRTGLSATPKTPAGATGDGELTPGEPS
jgi:hypothetical protein